MRSDEHREQLERRLAGRLGRVVAGELVHLFDPVGLELDGRPLFALRLPADATAGALVEPSRADTDLEAPAEPSTASVPAHHPGLSSLAGDTGRPEPASPPPAPVDPVEARRLRERGVALSRRAMDTFGAERPARGLSWLRGEVRRLAFPCADVQQLVDEHLRTGRAATLVVILSTIECDLEEAESARARSGTR